MTDFTIADVLAWARTKPADEPYSYIDSSICALAQFGAATGRPQCVGFEGTKLLWTLPDLKGALNPGPTYFRLGLPLRMDYGALVQRLETLCPAAPVPQSEWAAIDAYLTDIESVSADRLLEDEGSCQEVTKQIREWREEDRRAGITWSDEHGN